MNRKLLFLLVLIPLSAIDKEDCSPDSLDITETTHVVENLFYTGTCHYRNKNYNLSAQSWKKIASMDNVEPEFEELQISSLNNLGYLMFFGFGLEKDQESAIEYWTKAVSLGHEESEYHLCHAFADKDDGTYSPQRAKAHCKKAEAIYQAIEEKDEGDKEILRQIKIYKAVLDSL